MIDVFLSILNLSTTASLVAVAVLLLRLCMKKAPKWISAALWAFVGARLVFPFALESRFSIIPSIDTFAIQQSPATETFRVHTGVNAVNNTINNHIASTQSSAPVTDVLQLISVLWVAGIIAFLLYGVLSYLAVYLRVRTAIPLRDNIYQSENVKSPFVLGFVRPRIIVPFNLDDETLNNVILHENAHLKRKDHIVKPFAYLLLCFHWFNPLLWLSYILLCRDIEVACDEKVIKELTFAQRKTYALALLNCKVKNTTVAVCPVAFGEVSVKARIKNTLSYKKPAMWVIVAAVAASIIASGCLLTNPKAEEHYIETVISYHSNDSNEVSSIPTEAETIPATQNNQVIVTTPVTNPLPGEARETTAETQALTENFEEYYSEPVYTEAYTEAYISEETNEPAENIPQETEAYEEQEEYYYYEYDDSTEQDYVELTFPPLKITPEVHTDPYTGYSDSVSGLYVNQNNTPTFPVIVWDPAGNPNSINSYSVW